MAVSIETALELDVERAAQGDIEAFSRLVERSSSMVCAVAYAIVRDVPASEDIAQDVFLAVWRGLGKLKNRKSFFPWLRQITRNRANSWLRGIYAHRGHGHVGEEALAASIDPRPSAEAALEQREDLALVAQALEEIPDEAREVLILYYREGCSARQVGELLGLSPVAVRKRLSRARRQIRDDVAWRVQRGLERSTPGLALVTAAVTAATAPAAPASALAAGELTARVAAGSVKLSGLWGLLNAAFGVLGGVAGVVIGLRSEFVDALDARERCQLRWFRAVAVTMVAAAGLGLMWSVRWGHWFPPAAIYVVFVVALGALYFAWLPRIVSRRQRQSSVNDEEALERQRYRRRATLGGYVVGALMGGLGLVVGLWAAGLLG